MKKAKTTIYKKIVFFGSVCLAALIILLALSNCTHFSSMYAPSSYTVDDLFVDREYARSETLQGYKDYSGRVVKISPLSSGNWADYSRVIYRDLNLFDPGQYQITVSMSVMAERNTADTASLTAYRPSAIAGNTPSRIKWNGPANIGWTIQNSEDFYAQFGGKPVEVPLGRWVDLSFSQAFDFTSVNNMHFYMDGHGDQQGLIDLVLYVRHYKVEIKNSTKYIALTFDDAPTDFTHYLLDKLDEHEVKATFFAVGMGIDAVHPINDGNLTPADKMQKIRERRDIIKRMADDGHEIANLSYSYNYLGGGALDGNDNIDPLLAKENIIVLPDYSVTSYPLNEADIRKELEDTQIAIQKAVYGEAEYLNNPWLSKFVRVPYGIDVGNAAAFRKVAGDLGLTIVGGTEVAYDKSIQANTDDIVNTIVQETTPWKISINKEPRTDPSILRVLDVLIPRLKAEGYLFLTLSQMAERRREPLPFGKEYDDFDPGAVEPTTTP